MPAGFAPAPKPVDKFEKAKADAFQITSKPDHMDLNDAERIFKGENEDFSMSQPSQDHTIFTNPAFFKA